MKARIFVLPMLAAAVIAISGCGSTAHTDKFGQVRQECIAQAESFNKQYETLVGAERTRHNEASQYRSCIGLKTTEGKLSEHEGAEAEADTPEAQTEAQSTVLKHDLEKREEGAAP